mgnify:CR=1 FL=1
MNHKHHIIPQHLNSPCPLAKITIDLSIEEHAKYHFELFKKYGRWQDELAWKALCGQIGKEEIIREKLVNAGKSLKGLKKSEIARLNISKGLTGLKKSSIHKKNISISKYGKKPSLKSIQNMKDGFTEEVKKGISNNLKKTF